MNYDNTEAQKKIEELLREYSIQIEKRIATKLYKNKTYKYIKYKTKYLELS